MPGPGGLPSGESGNPNNMTAANASSVPAIYTPAFGQPSTQGPGQPGMQPNGQTAYQGSGQPANQANGQPAGTVAAANIPRPDGYINGRPNDAAPNPQPPQRGDASSAVAMVPATPLRPGEWRPSDDSQPPKPDPEEEKKKKKKHPYDNVKPDHDQMDWALRNIHDRAAAISRPVHIDCYADRLVIAPDRPGGEPHVIVCDSDNQGNADKLVAALWEVMDSWGMAGREMYWRPVLNFHVAPGAEPQLFALARALDGSGLVIERK